MSYILSVDPGNVTGVACYDTDNPIPPMVEEVEGGLRGLVGWWWRVFEYGGSELDHVFIEDFIIDGNTHKKTREPAAYEALGWVKGKCMEDGIPFNVYGAGEHTPFSGYKKKKTSKIARLGWSVPSKDMHADSASSVLLLGLKREFPEVARTLLKEIAE